MVDILKLGAWGAAGVLAGIGVVVWAAPETLAGRLTILIVCLLIAMVLRGLAGFVARRISAARTPPKRDE